MAETPRIGFVGVGSMGQAAHLRNYAALPDCHVAAIAEIRPELGRRVAGRFGVPALYRDHTEMLAAEELDGIVACQPFTRHGVLVPQLLEAGVPLFTEKPLAGSVAVGEQMVGALRQSGTWLMVGYNKRSDPATERARSEVQRLRESGELGALRYARITMPPGDWIAGGFAELVTSDEPAPELEHDPAPADMDAETHRAYLAFVNYYIHQVNLMRYLLGEPYRVTHADPSGVLLVGRSESGAACAIEMEPYRTTLDWQESALVAFEKGYVRLDLPPPLARNRAGSVRIFRDPGGGEPPRSEMPQLPPVDSMRRQAENFVRAIRGEARPPCEAEEALEDLKLARDYIRLLTGR
ncbi:MAG: Gfo/Idh/MocA family protein [Planctomycetota bacterium]